MTQWFVWSLHIGVGSSRIESLTILVKYTTEFEYSVKRFALHRISATIERDEKHRSEDNNASWDRNLER